MKPLIVFLVAVLALSCQQESNLEIQRWEALAENVTIIRDDFGVPHIYGKTDADAVFGLLYAQCEDDFMRVERNYIWAIGRLAEVEGEEALYSDVRARMYMTMDEAKDLYEQSPGWLKDLCNAFADGINYYLHTHPEVEPALLTRFEPWMPMYFSEGSIGGDIERVSTRRIRNFYEQGGAPIRQAIGDGGQEINRLDEPAGSNGFAIAGSMTESGNAMLLINPHTTFYFRAEVHVISEEGLNAYGAVTWGQFFVYQGFNEKTGWMHTSTYVDIIDEFKETIRGESGSYQYKYGDEWRDVEEFEITLRYAEDGGYVDRSFPIYRTHHGPITHIRDSQWVATALMWNPVQALTQSYTRTKKSGHDEFWEMMHMNTNSSNNTVYADADGNIAYYHGNFVPKRDVRFDYTQPVDGSDPATDWQGLHNLEEIITVVNPPNGWIQNCNSTPFTCCGDDSPRQQDFAAYMYSAPENFRGVHAISLLENAEKLTLDKLIDMAYDTYLPAFETLLPGLVSTYDRSGRSDNLQGAIDVLRSWDYRVAESSVAMTLAHYYGRHYLSSKSFPRNVSYMDRITILGTETPDAEKLSMFAEAVESIEDDFGTWNMPWGDVNRFQRITNTIDWHFDDDAPSIPIAMASGNWGALAAYGDRSGLSTKKMYGTRGNSFVAVVEFGDRVQAKSLLAGGQSGDPDSPHFDDQSQRYADADFKDVAYYREDVERRAEEMYNPGKSRK